MRTRSILAAIAALAIVAIPTFAAGPFAQVDAGSSSIDFRPTVSGVSLTLTVSGPDDFLFQKTFGAGDTASFGVFDASGDFLPEGSYTWRLEAAPQLTDAQRGAMADLRANGAGAAQKAALGAAGYEPMSGSFAIAQGAIVAGGETEPGQNPAGGNRLATKATVLATNDGVIRQSLCVGVDCPNSPSFGFDTLRLQENNTRLNFEDTSNSGSFPTTDWTIVANDSANGGQSYLAFQEDDAGTLPFKVRNGAGNNALYVHTNGDVGLGTGTPVLNLHIVDGDSPAIRLEQNNSSGFTPQTFDIAGNEANFFVRDVTNGSQLPFKIQPGADTNSLVVASDNDIGMGLLNPDQPLHIKRSGDTDFVLALLEHDGPARMRFANTADSVTWNIGHKNPDGDSFVFSDTGDADTEMELDISGNLTITGTLTQNSSRTVKHGFEPVDGRAVLASIAGMPMSTWIYDRDATGTRHIGPMAEDFFAAFQVGPGERHITVSDQAGVALAAIQGLNQVVEEKDQEIDELRAEIEELKRLVSELADN